MTLGCSAAARHGASRPQATETGQEMGKEILPRSPPEDLLSKGQVPSPEAGLNCERASLEDFLEV